MRKTLFLLFIIITLLIPTSIVSAKDKEWKTVMSGWFTGGNNEGTDDNEEDKRENDPALHPSLDLPLEIGIFLFTILYISLIVLFPGRLFQKKKGNQLI